MPRQSTRGGRHTLSLTHTRDWRPKGARCPPPPAPMSTMFHLLVLAQSLQRLETAARATGSLQAQATLCEVAATILKAGSNAAPPCTSEARTARSAFRTTKTRRPRSRSRSRSDKFAPGPLAPRAGPGWLRPRAACPMAWCPPSTHLPARGRSGATRPPSDHTVLLLSYNSIWVAGRAGARFSADKILRRVSSCPPFARRHLPLRHANSNGSQQFAPDIHDLP